MAELSSSNPLDRSSGLGPFPSSLSFNSTLGADYIGLVVASIFYGVTVLQTIIYYGTYGTDPLFLKLLVAFVWVLDTGSLIMFAHGAYTYLVTNYGNPAALAFVVRGITSEPIIAATIALTVHIFLAYRIYILSGKSRIGTGIAIFIVFLSLAPFAIGIYYVWKINTESQALISLRTIKWISIANGSISSAIDWMIVATTCYHLWRNHTRIKSTRRLITTLSLYAVSSGLITTFMTMSAVITGIAAPNTFVSQTFAILISKAHTNALMATLNVRQLVRNKNMPTYITAGDSLEELKAARPAGPTFVQVERETETHSSVENEAFSSAQTSKQGEMAV